MATASTHDETGLTLAAVDVGSNSIHMIIVRIDSAGTMTLLARQRQMVGLGRASFPSHKLSRIAMDNAAGTLRRFQEEANRWRCERFIAVATSAVREATNGGEFIERIRTELGIHIRVVSAREEARLIFQGVASSRDLSGGPHLILDIGGGSVEFIVAGGERGSTPKPLVLESRKLGAARMTAQFVKSDPVSERELKNLLAHYEAELTPVVAEVRKHKPTHFIATSGALENLATMTGENPADALATPLVLRTEELEKLCERLVESDATTRESMKGLDDKRRDQILAAALLVREVCRRLEIKEFSLCRAALREGIVADWLARHRPEMDLRLKVANPRRRSVYDLGYRAHWHREHAEQVARLTLRLFDGLRAHHGLDATDRELIEYGALLHDIGSLIGREGHHKHSAYLILNGGLDGRGGMTRDEVKTVACIARYHRKRMPEKSDAIYSDLSHHQKKVVKVGAALLRIADGLDRTNCSVVQDIAVRVRDAGVELRLTSRGEAELEVWSGQSRAKMFEKVFGRSIEIIQS